MARLAAKFADDSQMFPWLELQQRRERVDLIYFRWEEYIHSGLQGNYMHVHVQCVFTYSLPSSIGAAAALDPEFWDVGFESLASVREDLDAVIFAVHKADQTKIQNAMQQLICFWDRQGFWGTETAKAMAKQTGDKKSNTKANRFLVFVWSFGRVMSGNANRFLVFV